MFFYCRRTAKRWSVYISSKIRATKSPSIRRRIHSSIHVCMCVRDTINVCVCDAMLYARPASVWFRRMYFMICHFFPSSFFFFISRRLFSSWSLGKNSQTHATVAIHSMWIVCGTTEIFLLLFCHSEHVHFVLHYPRQTYSHSVRVGFYVSVSLRIGTGNWIKNLTRTRRQLWVWLCFRCHRFMLTTFDSNGIPTSIQF